MKMTKVQTKAVITVGLLALLMLTIPAQAHNVNKSVTIPAGTESDGASSVNGSVIIGENAVVHGDVETVNGSVTVDDNARIEDAATVNGAVRIGSGVHTDDLSTVNGAIRVKENTIVNGNIEAVNGSIRLAKGSTVARHVSNVNGEIEISGAQIGGDLSTVSGDIWLNDGAVVKGDLIVEKPGGSSWFSKNPRVPEIVIGPDTEIHGDIRLEREVKLYISNSATVGGVSGEMTLADAVRFDGDRP
jgi:DUF4097 and DUF4098 domain-containing protein YvlB